MIHLEIWRPGGHGDRRLAACCIGAAARCQTWRMVQDVSKVDCPRCLTSKVKELLRRKKARP